MSELKTILCVDDEPDVLMVAQMCLQRVGGFTVRAVSSGTDAVRRAAQERPDLILLDVMMPQMDGVATLQALRSQPQTADIPVIFMTARMRPSEVAEYKGFGACGVVGKPFDPMTLSREVRAIWEGPR